jgi:phospholipase/carboxylesterase
VAPALLPAIEIEPRLAARASVIWLHGLGAGAEDFAPAVPHLALPPELPVRFVFPEAPRRPVTINAGAVMPAWYDLTSLDGSAPEDEAGIRGAARELRALVERENARGVPSRSIALAGFSQGGAVALFAGLRHPQPLAGIAALSTYLVLAGTWERERHPANAATPVFLAHGELDPLVPLEAGLGLARALAALGNPVELARYPMEHQVCGAELADVGRFLARVLAGKHSAAAGGA